MIDWLISNPNGLQIGQILLTQNEDGYMDILGMPSGASDVGLVDAVTATPLYYS